MAPEPTPDHPEHKKKVNLTYVACPAMPPPAMETVMVGRIANPLFLQGCLGR
jgi:hypothetical protein